MRIILEVGNESVESAAVRMNHFFGDQFEMFRSQAGEVSQGKTYVNNLVADDRYLYNSILFLNFPNFL